MQSLDSVINYRNDFSRRENVQYRQIKFPPAIWKLNGPLQKYMLNQYMTFFNWPYTFNFLVDTFGNDRVLYENFLPAFDCSQ